MYLDELSKRVTQDLDNAISTDLPADERAAILRIVQKALLDAAQRTHKEYKETVIACCGPEADLAHKIQERMSKKLAALSANLMSMR